VADWNFAFPNANRPCLAGRLALGKVEPELSTRVMRPLYIISSILINLHGPEGLMDIWRSNSSCGNFPDCSQTPFLVELFLKFIMRANLFFPKHTFPLEKTKFFSWKLSWPISTIRRAALEGVWDLRLVKCGMDSEEMKEIFWKILVGDGNKDA
jgi:hypothetical protein